MELFKRAKSSIAIILSFIEILFAMYHCCLMLLTGFPFKVILIPYIISAVFYWRMSFKKATICTAALFFVFFTPTLGFGAVDKNAQDYPFRNEGAKWVSENPYAYFEVTEANCLGEITLMAKRTEFYMFCVTFSRDVVFFPQHLCEGEGNTSPQSEEWLFKGKYNYSIDKRKLIVKITDNSKGFLPDEIKKITFVLERSGKRR